MPFEDRSTSHLEVRSRIVEGFFIRNREAISDTKFRYETTANLKSNELLGLVQR
jgi:hypothetical protein